MFLNVSLRYKMMGDFLDIITDKTELLKKYWKKNFFGRNIWIQLPIITIYWR